MKNSLLILALLTTSILSNSCNVLDSVGVGSDCPVNLVKRNFYSNSNDQEVGIFFEAYDCNDEPVDIQISDIRGYEIVSGDRKELRTETQANLYPIEGDYLNSVVLVLDTSGSITQDSNVFNTLKSSAKSFAQSVLSSDNTVMSVVIFDGRRQAYLGSTQSGTNLFVNYSDIAGYLDSLACGQPMNHTGDILCVDNSTNLYNAVLGGADIALAIELFVKREGYLAQDGTYAGNVVTFTDGRDEANYESLSTVLSGISNNSEKLNFYTIGLKSADIDTDTLKKLGPDGYFEASDLSKLTKTFNDLARKLKAIANNLKRFAYCTATRNGSVRFVLKHLDSGNEIQEGFSANIKGLGCNLRNTNKMKPLKTLENASIKNPLK